MKTSVIMMMCQTITPITWSPTGKFRVLRKPNQRNALRDNTQNIQSRTDLGKLPSSPGPLSPTSTV